MVGCLRDGFKIFTKTSFFEVVNYSMLKNINIVNPYANPLNFTSFLEIGIYFEDKIYGEKTICIKYILLQKYEWFYPKIFCMKLVQKTIMAFRYLTGFE